MASDDLVLVEGEAGSAPLDAAGGWRCLPERDRHVWPIDNAAVNGLPHPFQRCVCGARRYGERSR